MSGTIAEDSRDQVQTDCTIKNDGDGERYGGLLPKRPPLISKDHERASFFLILRTPKGPLEALRPKLQPTPHHQGRSRRSAYAPADNGNEEDALESLRRIGNSFPHDHESKACCRKEH
ncbi:hypothetical protein ACJRO7_026765 [Eucalyptus globulus]|uniref:Uncharacterized protein n=1 Tax=Eucalyptus globulus TaxID=34317 RepID=A0ABD3JWB0_EUCGL